MIYNEDATGMSILEAAYGAQVHMHVPQTHAHTRDLSRGQSRLELFFICNSNQVVSERVDGVWEDEEGQMQDLATDLVPHLCAGVFVIYKWLVTLEKAFVPRELISTKPRPN